MALMGRRYAPSAAARRIVGKVLEQEGRLTVAKQVRDGVFTSQSLWIMCRIADAALQEGKPNA